MSTICITTGVPGSGKTYVRCARFLVDNFLPNQMGIHYSNFPVNREECSKFVHKKITRRSIFSRFFYRFIKHLTVDDILKRIEVIPYDVIQSWRREESGPWDYFNGVDLKYAHIAIDEVHEVISTSSSTDYVKKWDDFLGTIRHRGCTFEGITQDFAKVNRVFSGRASIRYELIPAEDQRDPFFSIKIMDWYELKAGLTGEFHKTVFQVEKRKGASGRWSVNHSERFLITPDYFRFYNSYNASLQESELSSGVDLPFNPFADPVPSDKKPEMEDDRTPLYEYQKRSKIGIIAWFIHRNWLNLITRISLAILVIWLCFFGGIAFLIDNFVNFMVKNTKQTSSISVVSSISDVSESDSDSSESAISDVSESDSDSSESAISDVSESDDDVEEKKISPYKIVLMDFNTVFFANGLRVDRGDTFPDGSKYGGLYVSNFDVRRRCVTLSDGVVLFMREFSEDD